MTPRKSDQELAEEYAREQARILLGSFDTHEAKQAVLFGLRAGRQQCLDLLMSEEAQEEFMRYWDEERTPTQLAWYDFLQQHFEKKTGGGDG